MKINKKQISHNTNHNKSIVSTLICVFIFALFFANNALAQDVVNQPVMSPNNFVLGTIQFFCMALIVYFLMVVNPAKAKEQSHSEFIEALKKNDNVFTTAGMYGKVVSIKKNEVSLEIAPNVKVKFDSKNLLPLPSSETNSDVKNDAKKNIEAKKISSKK